MPFGRSDRRDHADLDAILRPGEPGLHRGPRRFAVRCDPAIPDAVHLVEIGDIGEIEIGGEDSALVGAGLGEQGIDPGQYFGGLDGNARTLIVLRDLAG